MKLLGIAAAAGAAVLLLTKNASAAPNPSPGPSPGGGKPGKPNGVRVAGLSTSSVRVTWDPVPGATEYFVIHPAFQSEPEAVVARVTTPIATVGGLAWNSPYSVYVQASNNAGYGPRSEIARGSTLGR